MHPYTWQGIFARSPAHCGRYDERELPHVRWEWPKGTWFQSRREFVRERQPTQTGNLKNSANNATRNPPQVEINWNFLRLQSSKETAG